MINIGICYYYCCKDSDYIKYEIPDNNTEFLEYLDSINEDEIFISSKYQKLWDIILEYDSVSIESTEFYDCKYTLYYIICN